MSTEAAGQSELPSPTSFAARAPLVLRLSAVLAMLHGATSPAWHALIVVGSSATLVLDGLLTKGAIWFALAGITVLDTVFLWHAADNHKYLIAYWLLVCGFSTSTSFVQVARSARLLVGIAFGAAVVWKILAGQYLDGQFLYFTLLTEPRLSRVAAALTGIGLDDLAQARAAIPYFGSLGVTGIVMPLPGSETLLTTARGLSWLALVVEAAVAAAHLLPGDNLYYARHATLIAFICGTYFFLPVVGFAFVLTILGLAQAHPTDRFFRSLYLGLCGFVQLTQVPWQQWIGLG